MTNWNVFLPLKPFAIGKSRLRGLVDAERISLIKAMANDVIESLLQLPNVESVTVVGVNHHEVTTNQDLRIRSFVPTELAGINADVRRAIGECEKICIILPDLPAITTKELAIALDLAAANEQSFVPDFTGLGTTVYFATSSDAFEPRFGENSALAHSSTGAVELSHRAFAGIRYDCDDFSEMSTFPLSALGPATRAIMEQRMRK